MESAAPEHRGGGARGVRGDGGSGGNGGGVRVSGAPGERAHLYVGHGGGLNDGASPVLLAGAVLPADVPVARHGVGATRRLYQPPEQQPVEVLPERAADQIQCNWVDARVAVAQTEADDAQHQPEVVELLPGLRVVVEPQHEHVVGQEAHGKYQHERKHRFRHLFPGPHLTHLPLYRSHENTIFFILLVGVIELYERVHGQIY